MSSSFPANETSFNENEVSDNDSSLLRPLFDVTEIDTQGQSSLYRVYSVRYTLNSKKYNVSIMEFCNYLELRLLLWLYTQKLCQ